MEEEILQKIGLSKTETKIYLALLELGPSLAGTLAKKIQVNRSNIYDALQRLINKGFVSFVIKENRKYFEANNPEKIKILIQEKKEKILSEEKEFAKILPHLKEKKNLASEKLEASIYRGKKGMKTLLQDILKTKKEFFMIGGTGKASRGFPYYFPQFDIQRIKSKIYFKGIYASNEEGRKRLHEVKKLSMSEAKFFPENIQNVTTILIYGDKVAIIPISKTVMEDPIITLIEDKITANSFKDYFKWMWKIAKK